ncbi:MAG: glycogen debranching protein [Phycisphaerales bacterium]|nr:glycogen debranching protein [Phycisphaerales bacterium]
MQSAPFTPNFVDFGRAICNSDAAFDREWLVTNGIGGYAAGTIGGVRTRRYHGLLIAATNPPAERTLLLGESAPTAVYRGVRYPLAANAWKDGSVDPKGHLALQRFHLEDSIPVWRWSFADALLERRVFMVHGENTVCQHWTLVQASSPMRLELEVLVDRRSHHELGTGASSTPTISRIHRGVCLTWQADSRGSGMDLFVQCDKSVPTPTGVWWHDFHLREDSARGYHGVDSLWHAAKFTLVMNPKTTALFTASTRELDSVPANAMLDAERARLADLCARAGAAMRLPAIRQLICAGDQFLVKRARRDGSAGLSIIAGYPWFADWSRDAMISIYGLLLASDRVGEAQVVLSTYADYLDAGMLPNRFPDREGDPLEYNAVDAPLLMITAAAHAFAVGGDRAWLASIWAGLKSIVTAYTHGARHGIQVDPTDGLLRAGEAGVQLTWMDAKIGDRVITPRIGKPVEVNAFWYRALAAMSQLATAMDEPSAPYATAAAQVKSSFGKFWNIDHACCYDTIDGPNGVDAKLRPNQLFATTRAHGIDGPLPSGQCKAIVDLCMLRLWTPQGIRTLDAADPSYRGSYAGDPLARDEAYHQGTIWPWLFAPMMLSHFAVYQDRAAIQDFMLPFVNHLREAGLGSVSEVFSGDPPHEPGGCFAQAWSVAAILEILAELPPPNLVEAKVNG